MLRYGVSRLSVGLLVSMLTVGTLLPGKRATASDDLAKPAEKTKHPPSEKDVPMVREHPVRDRIVLNDICRVKGEGQNIFTKDGKITLALHKDHAGYRAAQETAEAINRQLSFASGATPMARALGQVNIEVAVPAKYRDNSVLFIAMVLSIQMLAQEVVERAAITAVPLLSGKRATAADGSAGPARKPTPMAQDPQRRNQIMLGEICRIKGEDENIFTKDGKIILMLHDNHAGYRVAQDVAEAVNSQMGFQSDWTDSPKALDQVNIEVTIPTRYRDEPVQLISLILSVSMIVRELDKPVATYKSPR